MGTILLNGSSLSVEDLNKLSTGNYNISLTQEAWNRVEESRAFVDKIARDDAPVYGINTGFGNFANTSIPKEKLEILQYNLITSHAAGVGEPLPLPRVRRMLAIRINILAKGYSGISVKTLETMIKAFNSSCLSYIPSKGSVGASGDLAPLAHLALGLIGYGKVWDKQLHQYGEAEMVLNKNGIDKIILGPKEGLAMINGTQYITALGSEAVNRSRNLVIVADIIGALTLEALKGTPKAFDARIHAQRPHSGQVASAARLRELLCYPSNPSTLYRSHSSCSSIQDAYCLRCMPQVHGIGILYFVLTLASDTLEFVEKIITTEINSATDNPMIFASDGISISGGNFHGEYPAKALDYLSIGIHELASISERRIERLLNPNLSGLPAFLTPKGGLNSGFMIAHCTAASLVSENKVLTHPSSVDSIPTSASKEDHVSMGAYSARKLLEVIDNVEYVLSIELLCACQGIEFNRPLQTTDMLEKVIIEVRKVAAPWEGDRIMYSDMEAAKELLQSGKIAELFALKS
jgi:histidine ammonia-lyase